MALKHHPMKNPDNMKIHLEKFHKICEAYEVLSSQQWKAIYDQYGHNNLMKGIKDPMSGLSTKGYVYQQNCYEIFDNYFLLNNPF